MNALRATCAGACIATFAVSAAAAMNDPTRPPASLPESAAAAVSAPLRAPPVLQSVIIGRASRAAIIDGERVEIGGRYRDAQVVRIAEDEVILRKDNMTQVLRMYPGVEKKTVPERAAAPARPAVPGEKPR
jgi:MSHA biogenesis protein MshK